MTTVGYESVDVTPWETASGGKATVCHLTAGCSLSTVLNQPSGTYDIAVQYFDSWRGASNFELLINGTSIEKWAADDTLPPAQFDPHLDGQTSTRFTLHGVAIASGDTLTLRGIPDMRKDLNESSGSASAAGSRSHNSYQHNDYREFAPVDYIELGPNGPLTPQY